MPEEQQQEDEIKVVFKKFDENGDERLEISELHKMLTLCNIHVEK